METPQPKKSKSHIFMVALLALITIAFVVSFYRYFYNLNYDIYVEIECDPAVSVCTAYEDAYYSKFYVAASELEKNCPDATDEDCIVRLYHAGKAEMLACEEYVAEEEMCTDPVDFQEEEHEE